LNLLKNRIRAGLTPAHILIIFYLFALSIISLLYTQFFFVLIYIIAILFVKFLSYISSSSNYILRNYVGKFFLSFVVTFIFSSLGYLIPKINPILYDRVLLNIDKYIFGVNPVVWIAENLAKPFLIEWFQINYFFYFFFVILIAIILIIKNKESDADFVIFSICFGFLVSYIGYIVFPALGPRDPTEEIELASDLLVVYPEKIQGIFFTTYLRNILVSLEKIKMNAFPSGHTMLTLLALSHYKKYTPNLFYFMLPVGISIILATLFCRYHYFIDVVAGIVLFILIKIIEKKVYVKILSFKQFLSK